MSPRRSDSRDRTILGTASPLREYGAHTTGIDRVLAHSGAPRGPVHQHVPGGRTQLIDDRWRPSTCPSPCGATGSWRAASGSAGRSLSAAAVFARRQESLAVLFVRHGLTEERSRRLGGLIVAAVEGAVEGEVIMCRTEQSTAPIEAAATGIDDLLRHAPRDRPNTESGPGP
ncbi:LmrA/YxaF family transcription factor [Streptomyces sp. NBC_00459]|uniref:LmrA/YxaF family transcription factor n=1 Tax=Streptomyces sp. NBC_00459 TaxID=2975749 RepID=UPI002E192471